jgi:hypothetical protein
VQIVQNNSSFGRRAITALGVSIIADGLDYFAAPLSSSPIIGDIFDSIITSMLYSITKSKLATAINLIEFIPFVGDFIPVYTLSTLYWISRELRKPEPDRSYNKGYYPKRNVVKNFAKMVLETGDSVGSCISGYDSKKIKPNKYD